MRLWNLEWANVTILILPVIKVCLPIIFKIFGLWPPGESRAASTPRFKNHCLAFAVCREGQCTSWLKSPIGAKQKDFPVFRLVAVL